MSATSNNQKLNGNMINLMNKNHLGQIQQNNNQQSTHQNLISLAQQQQQQQQSLQNQFSSSSSASNSTVNQQLPSQVVVHLHSQGNNIQQVSSSGGLLPPPRYQAPPQITVGGVLKNIPTNKLNGCYYQQDIDLTQLNIKYPPEIPKLASIYIPESVKISGNQSRYIQKLSSGHNNIQQHRLTGGHNSTICGIQQNQLQHEEHLIRHQQQQQQQQQTQQQQQQQQQQHHPQEMLKFVRKPETDANISNGTTNVPGSGRLTVEQNRQLQSLIGELRSLKEANQRLNDDNQELRDLCCFLDDDRQKGRKLAREWQRFGRYTASVMRQEVSAYQNKLRQLDDKQQELIRDNLELKELCLYLDEERAHVAANTLCSNCGGPTRPNLRDDGDGSSSSTNAEEIIPGIRSYDRQLSEMNIRSTLNNQTLQYVRSLERRIRQLEEEHTNGTGNVQQNIDLTSGRPEAVVRALQVLEVREQLERDRIGNSSGTLEQMDDGEKALVREMCNVVWRKIEDSTNGSNIDPI